MSELEKKVTKNLRKTIKNHGNNNDNKFSNFFIILKTHSAIFSRRHATLELAESVGRSRPIFFGVRSGDGNVQFEKL